jgi:hypothetical protein
VPNRAVLSVVGRVVRRSVIESQQKPCLRVHAESLLNREGAPSRPRYKHPVSPSDDRHHFAKAEGRKYDLRHLVRPTVRKRRNISDAVDVCPDTEAVLVLRVGAIYHVEEPPASGGFVAVHFNRAARW